MEGFKAPPILQFQENMDQNWKIWRQQFDNFMIASEKIGKEDAVKVAILLNHVGTEGLKIYNSFDFDSQEDSKKYDIVIQKFAAYCSPRKNIVYEHYKFFTRVQLESETTDQYLTALKEMADNCDFAEREVMLRDRIVLGTKYGSLQEKMLREPDLPLDRAMEYCRAFERSKSQIKDIQKSPCSDVDQITSMKKPKWRNRELAVNTPTTSKEGNQLSSKKRRCERCAYFHDDKYCPAIKNTCNRCLKPGHFAKVCRTRKTDGINIEGDSDDSGSESLVWLIATDENPKDWKGEFILNNSPVMLKIDTGSHVNILNIKLFRALHYKNKVYPSRNRLISYSGHNIEYYGVTTIKCRYGCSQLDLDFYIVDGPLQSIVGMTAARQLGLISETVKMQQFGHKSMEAVVSLSSEQILNRYKEVFEGDGKLKGKYKIKLKKQTESVSTPARKIPLAIRDEVRSEINDMVKKGILIPVAEPTEWSSPIVIVKSPRKRIRICMDPRALNKFIIRERCWVPTPETVFADLGKAKFFTVLDASNAFHQIQLDDVSSKLCTIATPFGRYRYTRLPYGLCSAPEVFQKAVTDILEGIPGTVNYIDDILVYGSTIEEHDLRLDQVMNRIHASGLKLSRNKMQLAVKKIRFLGHVITDQGIEPDPTKIEAIVGMKPPVNTKELQRVLGLITYLAKFIPRLSEETAPLRALLSKKNCWRWEPKGPEEMAFLKLKNLVTEPPVLKHFNPENDLVLSVDASKYGLGAVLMQNNGPVAYASASLTQAQQRYSQVEKELLAIVFACEHFNYYTFGRGLIVHTDHKPLLAIIKKPIDDLTPRLQRLVLRLFRYTISLIHVPGKQLQAPDALSRDPIQRTIDTLSIDETKVQCPITFTMPNRLETLVNETMRDSELCQVIKFCKEGWPLKARHIPSALKRFWTQRNSIHIADGVLYMGKAVVIPKQLRKEMLATIHNTHQGIVSCKLRAREALYWPGMMKEIQDMISGCEVCQRYSRSNSRETITPHEIPDLPWYKLGLDFKTVGSLNLLVLVDYFSKFVVVNRIEDKTTQSVINALKNIFAVEGLPSILCSDNGPPFDSFGYNEFLKRYGIRRSTSSPGYPESNGMIERMIQNVNAMIHKACEENGDLMLAVLNYNTTPKSNTVSPAEMLKGRKLQTLIPLSKALLNPIYDTTKHAQQLELNSQKMRNSRKIRTLPNLEKGQKVYLQKDIRNWVPARIEEKLDHNSFKVCTDQGRVLRRNRLKLRPCSEVASQNQKETEILSHDTIPDIEEVRDSFPRDSSDTDVVKDSKTENCTEFVPLKTRSGREVRPPVKLNL